MNVEIIVTLIATVGGLSGLVTAISTAAFKFLEYKKAQKGETTEAKLQPLIDKIHSLEEQLREIRLDTTRTQLLMVMEHQPHNHDTILKIAERYFLSLSGDWWMTAEFTKWANREGVGIPEALKTVIAKEHKS